MTAAEYQALHQPRTDKLHKVLHTLQSFPDEKNKTVFALRLMGAYFELDAKEVQFLIGQLQITGHI